MGGGGASGGDNSCCYKFKIFEKYPKPMLHSNNL